MKSKAQSISEYINSLSSDQKKAVTKLRSIIKKNLPKGFAEVFTYGMIGYAVPHSLYPEGYHCDPKLPLPFVNLSAQKNFIALYHMGIYSMKDLYSWFRDAYKKITGKKPDMGKSCIRFKNIDQIPHDLIAELMVKVTPAQWITFYEKTIKK
jgi:uncharacterized protein YdhG (YjbR/CyaY superfamily)